VLVEAGGEPDRAAQGPQPFPLLERDAELEAVRAAVASARGGAGRLEVVEGPAGIGKSRVLREALSIAESAGALALFARGSELEHEFGFGVALQLFERCVEALDPLERSELLSGAAGLAGALLGERKQRAEDGFAVIHGLFWLTSNLAERGPLILVVDDAHWADAPSLRFLLYLAERVGELAAAVFVSMRSGDPGTDEGLAAELAGLPVAELLALRPLSLTAVERMVRAVFPEAGDDFVRVCDELSRGNPFLVHGLLRETAQSGGTPSVDTLGSVAPRSVALGVLAQVARLPGRAGELAEAVAVLGDGVSLERAAALAGLTPAEAARAAEALAVAEIIGPGGGLAFAHPLLRSAVYDSTPRSSRAHMHLSAARLLREAGEPADHVAAQLLVSARGGAGWVVESLLEAARSAMDHGAPDSAATLLRRALAEPPPGPRRAEVLVELGRAEARVGLDSAPDRLSAALELVTESEERAAICFELGRMLATRGGFERAAYAFERGLEELGPGGADGELGLQLETGWVSTARLVSATRDAAAARLARLRRRPVPSTAMERVLWGTIAFELSVRAEPPDESIELARRALADGRLLTDETAGGLGFVSAATALGYAGLLTEAAEAFSRAIERARERGSVHDYARASVFRAFANHRLGNVQDAIADAQSALEHAVEGGHVAGPAAHAALAQALVDAGDLEGAAQALDSPRPEGWSDSAPHAYFLEARARLRGMRGDTDGAMEDLVECGRLLNRLRVTNPAVIAWRSQAAQAALRLGDVERAMRLVEEEQRLAAASARPSALGAALRARGLIERADAGVRSLEHATVQLKRSEARLEYAQALADLGAALRRAGRRSDSRDPLRRALELARRCGMARLAATVEEELAASGVKTTRSRPSSRGVLTPSERRVARMAAQGMTNRQIAEALFVTLKTVGWHLGNAYRKLGVGTREELAALFSSEDAETRSND
jgi:DNA-binding CsgD family transcriptional regulator